MCESVGYNTVVFEIAGCAQICTKLGYSRKYGMGAMEDIYSSVMESTRSGSDGRNRLTRKIFIWGKQLFGSWSEAMCTLFYNSGFVILAMLADDQCQSVSQLVGPPLWPTLKYLYNCWMECQKVL